MAVQMYHRGDQVEVWSNSNNAWMPDGIILEVAVVDCIMEGYSIPAGAVKVGFGESSSKWVLPPMVDSTLRKQNKGGPSAAAARPAPEAEAAVVRPLCKFGCGRQVQPGMTRGMKPFDTCCKRCALCSGARDEHDANCGGTFCTRVRTPSKVDYEHEIDPRRWILDLLGSSALLEEHARSTFAKVAEGKAIIPPAAVRLGIGEALCKPIGVKLDIPEPLLNAWMKKFDPAGKGGLDLTAFIRICGLALKDRREIWFPMKLPAKTLTFVRRNTVPVEKIYTFGNKLGEGSYGVVHMVTHKVSGEKRVCKRIQKMKGKSGMQLEEILAEIESMAMLDHPNVIKVYEYFEDQDSVSQIMEPCYGGELQDKIDDVYKRGQPAYSEAFICDVMKQTMRALAFMHSERFMHKDLKPQNIMLCDKESSSIKVIDFGLAELFEADREVSDNFGGTLLYMAPEVFKLELTTKVDIWSAGVILYNLVTGGYPYLAQWPLPPGRDMDWWQDETMRLICEEPWKPNGRVSPLCKSLLDQMLSKDPSARPDAAACLEHPWFKQFSQMPPPLSVGVTQCLEAYSGQPELKKAIFLLIAHQLTKPVLTELRNIFTHFDDLNRGALSATSLREVLRTAGMSLLQTEKIIYALDKDDSGMIEWTEFIAAALCISVCSEKRLVEAAFSIFDANNDGKITAADIGEVFAKGDVEDVWKRRLPDECGFMGGPGPYTLGMFSKYMGQRMKVTGGDLLSAVD